MYLSDHSLRPILGKGDAFMNHFVQQETARLYAHYPIQTAPRSFRLAA